MKEAPPLEGDRFGNAPAPRESPHVVGHEEAQAMVRTAWDAGRLPHALLIGGAEGIGKATLAYAIARFVLSGGAAPAHSISVDPSHPAARQVAALSHPDLMVLRRVPNDSGKLPSMIPAEQVRRVRSFFGSTAALGGWRVCVVDTLDEMNAQGANALLKTLEEPPPRALFLLVCHAPGRVLPTIRSRTRLVRLRPLGEADVLAALDDLKPQMDDLDPGRLPAAAAAAEGSVRRAIVLARGAGLEVRAATERLLEQMPDARPEEMHALGARLQGDKADGLDLFIEAVSDWIAHALTAQRYDRARLVRLGEVWDKVRRAAAEADTFNLDRKALVFRIFTELGAALRG